MKWNPASVRRIAAAAAMALPAAVSAAEPSYQELEAKIARLEERLGQVESKRSTATTQPSGAPSGALNGSDQRGRVAAGQGFTAGFEKGKFVIQSADGKNRLVPTAQLQGRYVAGRRDDSKHGESSFDDGFEIRRAKFGFVGNIVSEDLSYRFQWGTTRGDVTKTRDVDTNGDGRPDTTVTDVTTAGGTPVLEDAWLRYRIGSDFAVYAGQFEDPVSHEALVSSGRQLAAEESAASALLINGPTDYVQGIGLAYENSRVRTTGVFHDGAKSTNTNFQDFGDSGKQTNWGATARLELKAIGDNWKQYDDFTALGNKSDLLVFGAGADYTQGDDRNTIYYGVDAQWEPTAVKGLALFAAYVGQSIETNSINGGADPADLDNHGYVLQAGYLLNPKWEIFARYDVVEFDSAQFAPAANNSLTEVTVGANYYINAHAAKLTADLTWLPEGYDGAGIGKNSAAGLGILPTNGDADEIFARVQFQLLL